MGLDVAQHEYATTLQPPGDCSAAQDTILGCRRIKLLCVHGQPVAWAVGFNCTYCRRLHVFRFGLDDAIDIPHYRWSHCSDGSPLKGQNVQILVCERPGRKDLPPDFVSLDDALQHIHARGVNIVQQSLVRWISHGLGGCQLTAIRTREGIFTTKELIDEFLRASGRLEIDTIRPLTGREELAQMLKEFQEGGLEHGETLIESCDLEAARRLAAV